MLQSVMADHGPAALITVFDPPPPTFRHELYPPYKANRPVPPDEFLDECWDLTQLLRDNGVPVYEEAGFEADDVLGTLAKQASQSGLRSLVYTCDLDLLQIINENTLVEVFSQYWPKRLFDMESASRRFNGIMPANIPDLKALMGDRSDNLPGVPGIGEKSASAILRNTGDIETLYADLDAVLELQLRGSRRIHKLLTENETQAFLMKRLATIDLNVPVTLKLPVTEFQSCNLRSMASRYQ